MLLTTQSALAGEDSGFYVGGSLGRSDLNIDELDEIDTNDFKIDDDDNAYKIMVGFNLGIIPLIDLAVEAAYRDFGEFQGRSVLGNTEAEADSIDVFGLAALTFGPLAVFGKVGFVDWNVDTAIDDRNIDQSQTQPMALARAFSLAPLLFGGSTKSLKLVILTNFQCCLLA